MSRYARFRSPRYRKDARNHPLYGSEVFGNGEHSGKYFRCWNCGARCDKDRESLGGPFDGNGNEYEDVKVLSPSRTGKAVLGGPIGSHVAAALDAAGDAKIPEPSTIKSVATSGCWFCGCKNYKGEY